MTCSGIYTALITPFDTEGCVDYLGLKFHIRRQLAAGIDGLVVLGTTGESPTLTAQEKEKIIVLAREETQGFPLMVGCGAYSTAQTIENVKIAADLGADSVLIVSPFYNRPTQEGLFRHFESISQASPIPILLYNHLGRTGVNIDVATLRRLAELPNIIGIKDSSGNITYGSEIIYEIKSKRPDFALISGDDPLNYPIMAIGGDGAISVASNLIPQEMKTLMQACQREDFTQAQKLHINLMPLFKALSFESNPIPVKAALKLAGLPAGIPRLPLTPLSTGLLKSLKEIVKLKSEDLANYIA